MKTKLPGPVLIKGAGDLASGVSHRLYRAGFDIIMLELPQPLVVRRTASFAEAVFRGETVLEGVKARLCPTAENAVQALQRKEIPILVDPAGQLGLRFNPPVLIDAIMAKRNTGTALSDAPLVIGLGPGFSAGNDVHAVIETMRGHNLGRVIYAGEAEENTAVPGEVGGKGLERLLRSPGEGEFEPLCSIGDLVEKGQLVAKVGSGKVVAATGGLIRGLLYPGIMVKPGMKVGDIDPRGRSVDWHTISDKARAIGGGALEAIMHHFFFRDNGREDL